jgi:hypothetical protein
MEFCRHGARQPSISSAYPNITDTATPAFEGNQYLIPPGERQHYILGRALRFLYVETLKLLKPSYDPGEVYIRSTEASRALQSAQAQMLGLFPFTGNVLEMDQHLLMSFNGGSNKWGPLPFQPSPQTIQEARNSIKATKKKKVPILPKKYAVFPVYSVPGSQDDILKAYSKSTCPGAEIQRALITKTKEYKNEKKRLEKECVPYARQFYKGTHDQQFLDNMGLKEATKLADFAIIALLNKVPFKNELTEEMLNCFYQMGNFKLYKKIYGSETLLKILNTKTFMQLERLLDYAIDREKNPHDFGQRAMQHHELIAEFDDAYLERLLWLRKNPDALEKLKFILFSGHEAEEAAVLNGLGHPQHTRPVYASTVIIELNHEPSEGFYVVVKYDGVPLKLDICEGEEKCEVDLFKKGMKKSMFESYEEWEETCHKKPEKDKKDTKEKDKAEKQKAEKEKIEKEKAEKERIEKENAEKERIEKEKAEKERLEREKVEKDAKQIESEKLKAAEEARKREDSEGKEPETKPLNSPEGIKEETEAATHTEPTQEEDTPQTHTPSSTSSGQATQPQTTPETKDNNQNTPQITQEQESSLMLFIIIGVVLFIIIIVLIIALMVNYLFNLLFYDPFLFSFIFYYRKTKRNLTDPRKPSNTISK